MERYERSVRAASADCRCVECNGLIRQGDAHARIRVNVWGRLWRTLSCCRDCCKLAHTGVRPFVESSFGRVSQVSK